MLEIEEFLTKILTYEVKIDSWMTGLYEVILLESLQYPWWFTETIIECIFTRFKQVDKVYVFLWNTLPIYTHAVNSGLVIDTGFL